MRVGADGPRSGFLSTAAAGARGRRAGRAEGGAASDENVNLNVIVGAAALHLHFFQRPGPIDRYDRTLLQDRRNILSSRFRVYFRISAAASSNLGPAGRARTAPPRGSRLGISEDMP
ncbi:hypothetical protein EVAR_64289_1 [Eumeta japonica]|uniref:Uncharacterized protein n=1 Tax=Eumeta variegata TaxID=151549 RepID=A0A4C1ZZX6_EUMVA|nr:hypothetical protein EVAR_64289_1 [Eumeta japonica]